MRIYLAADHAGFELKEKIKTYLKERKFDVEDCGASEFNKDDDYPDLISKAAERVSEDQSSKAIVFGKSGTGEAIVANKFKNVRAVVGFNLENVRLSRTHNDANVLSLGSQFVDFETAKQMIDIFLTTDFSNEERHVRRINKIKAF